MAKKSKSDLSKPTDIEPAAPPASASWWYRNINKLKILFLAATAPVILNIYQHGLTTAVQDTASNAWAWLAEAPMSDDFLIRIDLEFGAPTNTKGDRVERTSVTLWPQRCKRLNGDTLTRTFDSRQNSYQNAIIQVACNHAGRTKITLTPATGAVATVYDGMPKDTETLPFPGVADSYRLGKVHITKVHSNTKWVPINKCQLMNNCYEIDPDYPD